MKSYILSNIKKKINYTLWYNSGHERQHNDIVLEMRFNRMLYEEMKGSHVGNVIMPTLRNEIIIIWLCDTI